MKIMIHFSWFFIWIEHTKNEYIFKLDLWHRAGIINSKFTKERAV